MTGIFLWAARSFFAVVVVALVGVGFFLASFATQRDERVKSLELASRLVTTPVGEIEVVTFGSSDAPAVLVLHGTPGGYDQALAIGRLFVGEGDFVIAPSRPGYLRTPLVSGFLFADQADAMAALLDSLKVTDAAVIGFGAGAVVATEMAIRHPDRVRGLVLISPPTLPLPAVVSGTFGGINYLGAQVMADVGGDLGAFLLSGAWDDDPLSVTRRVLALDTTREDLKAPAEFILNDPEQRKLMGEMVDSIYPMSPREMGARNDLVHLRHPQLLGFASINCPVLVLSGAQDRAREVIKPEQITEAAKDAASEVVPGAGSLVWFGPGAAEANEKVRAFIQNLPPPLPTE